MDNLSLSLGLSHHTRLSAALNPVFARSLLSPIQPLSYHLSSLGPDAELTGCHNPQSSSDPGSITQTCHRLSCSGSYPPQVQTPESMIGSPSRGSPPTQRYWNSRFAIHPLGGQRQTSLLHGPTEEARVARRASGIRPHPASPVIPTTLRAIRSTRCPLVHMGNTRRRTISGSNSVTGPNGTLAPHAAPTPKRAFRRT
jgi:hypothetical protein